MPFRRLKDYDLNRLPDEELVAYAVAAREAGEPDAMKEALAILVFRRFDDLVRRARLKVPAADAEDVASKTIGDAIIARFKGVSVGEFMVMVNRILSRRVADFHKKRERTIKAGPLLEEHEGDEGVHGQPGAGVADDTELLDTQDVIDRVKAALSDVHRRVVELNVSEGYTADEVAAKVNAEHAELNPPMSVDNVHKIASRFRKDLRRALEDSA